jgi:type IV secretory pathway TraG/TraD family ATPase VirD4
MLLAIVFAISSSLLWRGWWYRTPFDISGRLPRKLSLRPRLGWYQRLFLGWTTGLLGEPRWAMGTYEDSAGVVGPTRVGKTGGAGIGQAVTWGGPAIVIAPKPQVFRAAAGRRQRLADLFGGTVTIYAPTVGGRVEGLRPLHFSPCATTDLAEIQSRVDTWIEAAGTARGVQDEHHWKAGAAKILRGLFLAAAHHPFRPGDFSLVRKWLTMDPEEAVDEPIAILRSLKSLGADDWANELAGVKAKKAEREREGFFSAADIAVRATANPSVLRSAMENELDIDRFLLTRSSLFVVSPLQHQKLVGPLIALLVEAIVNRAYELHSQGRLEARLLVSIDDLVNCAPLPSLGTIISLGGGQGVNVCWSLQNLAQLRAHYGPDAALAIWDATRCKVVFGGGTDEATSDRLSVLIGDERVHVESHTVAPDGKHHRGLNEQWRRILSPAQIRRIPDGWSLLLYHNEPPYMVRQHLTEKRGHFRAALVPWRKPSRAPQAAVPAEPAAEV